MGTVSFLGVKRPVLGVDHPPPSSAEVEGRVHLLSLWAVVACSRVTFTLPFQREPYINARVYKYFKNLGATSKF
jgi:hypothetical protein